MIFKVHIPVFTLENRQEKKIKAAENAVTELRNAISELGRDNAILLGNSELCDEIASHLNTGKRKSIFHITKKIDTEAVDKQLCKIEKLLEQLRTEVDILESEIVTELVKGMPQG